MKRAPVSAVKRSSAASRRSSRSGETWSAAFRLRMRMESVSISASAALVARALSSISRCARLRAPVTAVESWFSFSTSAWAARTASCCAGAEEGCAASVLKASFSLPSRPPSEVPASGAPCTASMLCSRLSRAPSPVTVAPRANTSRCRAASTLRVSGPSVTPMPEESGTELCVFCCLRV
jgi:hypothetical protein